MFRPGVDDARRQLVEWRARFFKLFSQVELLALPTLPMFPPRLDELNAETLFPTVIEITKHVAVFNAAGSPCTAQPVPVVGNRLPASLQLVGPLGGEELLLTTAQSVQDAIES
jgi:amidase